MMLSEQNNHEGETTKNRFDMTNHDGKILSSFRSYPPPTQKSLASLASCPFSLAGTVGK